MLKIAVCKPHKNCGIYNGFCSRKNIKKYKLQLNHLRKKYRFQKNGIYQYMGIGLPVTRH